jgi:hypothetical protein
LFRRIKTGLVVVAAAALMVSLAQAQGQTSKPFSGAKVNGGSVTHSMKDGKHVLTLSDDFKVPDTPDPHWQVVDSKGRTYLLQQGALPAAGPFGSYNWTLDLTPGSPLTWSWPASMLSKKSFATIDSSCIAGDGATIGNLSCSRRLPALQNEPITSDSSANSNCVADCR